MQNMALITGLSIEEAVAGLYDGQLSGSNARLTEHLIANNASVYQMWIDLVRSQCELAGSPESPKG